jgi:hypothetical protein
MLDSLDHLARVSTEWGINTEDVMLIALNACGVRSQFTQPRMRFQLRLNSRWDEPLFVIVSLGREDSPFELDRDELRLHGTPVAAVVGIENDDVVLGYWRNGRRMLTLNSNARSQCTGCVFCPNTLEDAADPRLRKPDLDMYFSALASGAPEGDLSGVETVTVCTGCFLYEHLALDHLAQVRTVMEVYGCDGVLHFLSSVLTTPHGLDRAAGLGPFHLTLTAECFTRRPVILKRSKAALSPADMVAVLGTAKQRSITTDFTYIVGLDDIDVAERHLAEFVPVTTTFPRFQVYQAHNTFMNIYRTPSADRIEFFLDMRRRVERLFGPLGLRPQWWQNYRSLWCFTFAGEELPGPRI